MEWGRGEPLFATDHMRDLHQVIIHNIGQVIGGEPIGFKQDFIIHVFRMNFDISPDQVRKTDHLSFRYLQPDNVRLP